MVEDRKAARTQETDALREAQGILADAFKEKADDEAEEERPKEEEPGDARPHVAPKVRAQQVVSQRAWRELQLHDLLLLLHELRDQVAQHVGAVFRAELPDIGQDGGIQHVPVTVARIPRGLPDQAVD